MWFTVTTPAKINNFSAVGTHLRAEDREAVFIREFNGNKTAYKVSAVSIAVNFVLTAFKLIAGIFARSGAMLSDAVHSASDVLSTVIVIIGVKISSKASDADHRYGHERMECVAAVLLSVILFATSLGIGWDGIRKIFAGNYEALPVPGALALIAAAVSIICKEWMFQYTKRAANKINSDALRADAWHHRSDALSSVGSLIGVYAARSGYPIADPVVSIVICVIIVKAAFGIFKDALDKMVDKSCDPKTVEAMERTALSQDKVIDVDDIRTRLFGSKVYVDMEICCDGNMTLAEAHRVAESVHHSLEKTFPQIKHCMVHVNPDKDVDDA